MLSLITNMRQLFSFSVTMTEEFIFAILNISKKMEGEKIWRFFPVIQWLPWETVQKAEI